MCPPTGISVVVPRSAQTKIWSTDQGLDLTVFLLCKNRFPKMSKFMLRWTAITFFHTNAQFLFTSAAQQWRSLPKTPPCTRMCSSLMPVRSGNISLVLRMLGARFSTAPAFSFFRLPLFATTNCVLFWVGGSIAGPRQGRTDLGAEAVYESVYAHCFISPRSAAADFFDSQALRV